MVEPIILQSLTASERRKKAREKLPTPLKILTSLKTTAVLGTTLAALLNPVAAAAAARTAAKALVPKTFKQAAFTAITLPTGVGILSSSKKAREITKSALDPREAVKRGKKIGEIIEDPGKASDILGIKKGFTAKEKIIAGAKAAGKAGAIIAGGIAVAGAGKKVKEILEKRKADKAAKVVQLPSQIKQLGFTEPQPVGIGGVPVAVRQTLKPREAPGQAISPKPIQNIIQIQVS